MVMADSYGNGDGKWNLHESVVRRKKLFLLGLNM